MARDFKDYKDAFWSIAYDHVGEVLLVGNYGVGCTSLLTRYAGLEERFRDSNFTFTITTVLEGKEIQLHIGRDINNYNRYELGHTHSDYDVHYRRQKGIILVYDITDIQTFECIEDFWLPEIEHYCDRDVQRLLIGNKLDLEEQRAVPKEKGVELARQLGIPFLETSTKTNHNVTEAFEQLAKCIMMADSISRPQRPAKSLNFLPYVKLLLHAAHRRKNNFTTDKVCVAESLLSKYMGSPPSSPQDLIRAKYLGSSSLSSRLGMHDVWNKTINLMGKKIELLITYGRYLTYGQKFMGVILLYDITQPWTFEHIKEWLRGNKYTTSEHLLIGDNAHLEDLRKVSREEGMMLAKQYGMFFIETSAETNHNVTEAFELLARRIVMKELQERTNTTKSEGVLNTYSLKLMISGVGKADVTSRYASFTDVTGVCCNIIELNGKTVRLQIWTEEGNNEKFMGIILVYDITNQGSFHSITKWLQSQDHKLHVECLLIGNNSHLEEQREVMREDGVRLARQYGIPFLETSAKTDHNITEAFELLVRMILNKQTHTLELQGTSAVMVGEDRLSRKPCDHLFKLMLVGDSGVGKARTLSKYTDELLMHTRDVDIMTKSIELKKIKATLVIWKKGRTPAYLNDQDIPHLYYRASMGIILVYDITKQKSFKNIRKWLQRVKRHASSDVQCLLIGNNSHLEEQRAVPREEGVELARQLGIPFLETSAETNYNIVEAFELLAGLILMKEMNESERHLMALETTLKEKQHMQAFEAALEEKGCLDQTIIHCLFFGHPRGGKSSLMKRLTGHPPIPNTPSTGVAEKAEVFTSTAVSSHSHWSLLTLDDEAIALMAIASQTFPVEIGLARSAALEPGASNLDDIATSNDDVTSDTPPSSSKVPFSNERAETSETTPATAGDEATPITSSAQTSASTDTAGVDASSQLPDDHVSPMDVLKKAIMQRGLEGVKQYLQGSLTLYLTDTGGQMEFQELLPALVAGPSVFFVVFRLDQDLNKTFTIEYLHPDGQSAEPYQSTFSVKETLLQSLTSIASMGTFVYSKKLKKKVPLKPKVVLVGTHKDKVSQRKIARIDRDLQQMVKATSLYRDGLIEFASETQLVITVNNLSRDTSDFQLIRSVVQRITERGDFKVSSPSTWLIFSLLIRQQKKRIITYDECSRIAHSCGIANKDELNEALWFLNTKVGLVRHFRGEGLEELEGIVIIDPQILFDKITKLIVQTFTFQNVTADVHEEFTRKGIFPVSVLERLNSSDYEDQLLTVSRLVKLLEHLHIIVRLHSNTEEVKYFMPCTLAHAGSTAPVLANLSSLLNYFIRLIFSGDESKQITIPLLVVTFKCGCCPKGLFSALCVFLLANKMKSHLNWELQTDQIYKNAISFSVGPFDTMTISVTPTYMEVAVVPDKKNQNRVFPIEETCTEVRQCIETAVREVTSSLNYTWDAEHALAFYCPGDHEGLKDKHPAIVQYYNNKPANIKCELTQQKVTYDLPKGHEYWFCEQTKAAETSDMDHSSEMNSEDLHLVPTLKQLQNLDKGEERLRLISELTPYWEELAIELDFPASTITQIRLERHKPVDQCREVFCTWLGPQSPSSLEPTWTSLIIAMKNIDLVALASQLERMLKVIPAESSEVVHRHPEVSPDNTELAPVPTLKQLQNLKRGGERLRLISELIPYWEELAIELDFPTSTIEKIRLEKPLRPADQCRELFSIWLGPQSLSSLEPTWETLISAMKNIDLTALASQLERMIKASSP